MFINLKALNCYGWHPSSFSIVRCTTPLVIVTIDSLYTLDDDDDVLLFSSSYAQVIKTFFIPLSTSKPLYTFDIMCIFYKFFLLHSSKHSKQGSRQTSLDYIWFVLFCFISTLWKNIAMRDNIITRTFLCDMEKNKIKRILFLFSHPTTPTPSSYYNYSIIIVCVFLFFFAFYFPLAPTLHHPPPEYHDVYYKQSCTCFYCRQEISVSDANSISL